MDGGKRQQTGDGRIVRVHAAIRKNEKRIPGLDGERGATTELRQSALETLFTFVYGEQHWQGRSQEIALRDATQFFQVAVGEDGMRQLECVAVLRRLRQDVAF